ncbi:CAP domain-containing protein [Leptodontidium sp. 2 PMI_412]|nr:CAP domain-containing protein [Leptodontidium sp. 2 PMI_412]
MSISAEEKQKAVDLHNEARREAPGGSRPDLVWSNTLAAAAEEWGKKMVRQTWRPGDLKHDPTLRQKTATMGENLFGGNGGRMTLSTACRGWIIEKLDYEGEPVTANGIDKRRKKIGHYTQIIWPKTTKVGMAKITVGDWQYIVARYDGPQKIGGLPWGGATSLPRTPNMKPEAPGPTLESSRDQICPLKQAKREGERDSRHAPESSRIHKRNSSSHLKKKEKPSVVESVLESIPKMTLKIPGLGPISSRRKKSR